MCIDLADEHGPVHCYLLPFIKPVHVRASHPEADITSYNDALKIAIEDMQEMAWYFAARLSGMKNK